MLYVNHISKTWGKLDNKESHRSSEYISVSVTAVFFLFFHKNTEKKIISKLKRHLPEDFQSLHFFFLIAAYLLGETQKSFFLRTETVSFIKKNPFAFQFEGKSLHMAVKSLRPCTCYGVWIRLKLDRNGQWNH